jgi:DNA polymerase III delta prime subunit
MLESIKTYKFIKDKNGNYKQKPFVLQKKTKSTKTTTEISKTPKKKVSLIRKNEKNIINIPKIMKEESKISKLKKRSKNKYDNLYNDDEELNNVVNSFNINQEYISYNEIQKRLKQQKQKTEVDIMKSDIVKSKSLPVNKNKFILHQYLFEDKRNKIHDEIHVQLQKMTNQGFLTNHILFHGLCGSGKYTLGLYLLHHIYGGIISKRIVRVQTINKKQIKYIENPYYLEILINNYVINDHHTLSNFIKNNTKNKRSGLYQYILIKHFDELTIQCQKSVFHLMEKLSNVKFILTTRHLSRLTDNITSICNCIRVPRPDPKLLAKYLNRIAKSNNINVTHSQIEYIVRSNECNISQSLTTLELATYTGNYVKTKDAHFKYIANILQTATGPCVQNIRNIRNLVSKLIISTYDVSDVYRTCVKLFLNSNYDMEIKQQVIEIANKYSQLNNTTHNSIFIMEAFFLHIMRIINNVSVKKTYSLQKISKKK